MERIRDFIILHYHANQRENEPFWDDLRAMAVPETLQHKIDLFRASARVSASFDELFDARAWIQVLIGQNIIPETYHPIADLLPEARLEGVPRRARAGARSGSVALGRPWRVRRQVRAREARAGAGMMSPQLSRLPQRRQRLTTTARGCPRTRSSISCCPTGSRTAIRRTTAAGLPATGFTPASIRRARASTTAATSRA